MRRMAVMDVEFAFLSSKDVFSSLKWEEERGLGHGSLC